MTAMHDTTFRAMGSDMRLIIAPPLVGAHPTAAEAAADARAYLDDFARRLSRFQPDSELCRLNDDPRTEVPASALLRAAVGAGLWAAQRTGGLVDPTLLGELEATGYVRSRDGQQPAPLRVALASVPRRRPARPHPAARWRTIELDDRRRTVRRPPGVRIDTGGTGKGLAADAVAHRLSGHARFVVDCGGDLAIGGPGAQLEPFAIEVQHPLSGESVHTLYVSAGGVATSGLNVNVWSLPDGSYAHHLLDPCTGAPAWTGLMAVTAVAPSALEAETLSKAALLLGPHGARKMLAADGGVIVHDSGDVEPVEPAWARPRMTLHLTPSAA